MWSRASLVGLLLSGCLRPDLLECENGVACPLGMVCWEEERTCIDPQGLTLAEGPFDFGPIQCGQGGELVVELENRGRTAIPFDASSTLEGVTITPSQGRIDAGESVSLRVVAEVLATSIPGESMIGTLDVDTFVGRMTRTLRLTTVGGVATVEPIIDFGDRMVGSSYEETLEIGNDGNAPFTVTATAAGMGFAISDDFSIVDIAPMSTSSIPITFAPTTLRTFMGTVALAYDQTLCQSPEDTVGIVGVVSGSPLESSRSVIAFEDAGCGDDAASKTFSLTNRHAVTQTLTFQIEGDHAGDFAVLPTTVTVSPGGTTNIAVTRNQNPRITNVGDRTATLEITAAPSGSTKTIPLSHRILGSILRATPDSVRLDVLAGRTKTLTLELTNDGNQPAVITTVPAIVMQAGSTVNVLPNPFQVEAGSVTTFSVSASGGNANTDITTIAVMSAGNQCSRNVEIPIQVTVMATEVLEVE